MLHPAPSLRFTTMLRRFTNYNLASRRPTTHDERHLVVAALPKSPVENDVLRIENTLI